MFAGGWQEGKEENQGLAIQPEPSAGLLCPGPGGQPGRAGRAPVKEAPIPMAATHSFERLSYIAILDEGKIFDSSQQSFKFQSCASKFLGSTSISGWRWISLL